MSDALLTIAVMAPVAFALGLIAPLLGSGTPVREWPRILRLAFTRDRRG